MGVQALVAIALIAAVLGFSGIAGTAVNLAWICAIIGIIFAVVFGVMARSPRIYVQRNYARSYAQ